MEGSKSEIHPSEQESEVRHLSPGQPSPHQWRHTLAESGSSQRAGALPTGRLHPSLLKARAEETEVWWEMLNSQRVGVVR